MVSQTARLNEMMEAVHGNNIQNSLNGVKWS